MQIIKKLFILFFISSLFINCKETSNLPKIKIEIKNKNYTFEVAATNTARKTGLMFKKFLDKNSGMLFVYGRMTVLSFYMKNTLIPLDIAFIDNQNRIVDIQKMEPLDETSIISKDDAQYALEVNKGFFDRVGLKQGDKIIFLTPIPYPEE